MCERQKYQEARETLGCSTIHLVLFDNSRTGRLKLELIEHNQFPDYVRLILISTFDTF